MTYLGTDGDDVMNGYDSGFNYNASEILKGGMGNDTIQGGVGDDTLIGGTGDDKLYGGTGADTYEFSKGDGKDLVGTYTGWNEDWMTDKIKFRNVRSKDVELRREGNQLILVNKKTDDTITVGSYYADKWHGIGAIEFSDNVTWTHEFIGQYQMTYFGTDGDDVMNGYDGGFNYNTSEILNGGSGNDKIMGGKGDDTLIGGTGDDALNGGLGSDTYFFARGDGNDLINTYTGWNEDWMTDKIRFKNVRSNAVELQREGNNLILWNKQTGDRITVGSYYADKWHGIGSIDFYGASCMI